MQTETNQKWLTHSCIGFSRLYFRHFWCLNTEIEGKNRLLKFTMLKSFRTYLWQRTASILSWGQFTTRLACPTLRLSIRTHNILGSQCRCFLKPVHDQTVPSQTLPWGHLTFSVFRTAVFTITAAHSLQYTIVNHQNLICQETVRSFAWLCCIMD